MNKEQKLNDADKQQLNIADVSSSSFYDLDKCDCCGGYLDQFAENGTCFECILNSSIAGNYSSY